MGLLDIFRQSAPAQASVETGSLRDMYMMHLEQANLQGVQPLPFPEFVKLVQQQQLQQKQMQDKMLQEQLMRNRGLLSPGR